LFHRLKFSLRKAFHIIYIMSRKLCVVPVKTCLMEL
jgi:hypothetical protein